ncbi:Hypothetical protein CINCED_3A020329 [Cinara cedri]|uniref:Uncharacterized protein n=1 Tax=Cinara cedri TaxID=506608 RepID=A0A5E4MPG3_9HEMI|nr:Hypothetical protein CINCED_3A020329 [Cinara cedri]
MRTSASDDVIATAAARRRLGQRDRQPRPVAQAPATASSVLGPWYESGRVMRPERACSECTRPHGECPKCRAAGRTYGDPLGSARAPCAALRQVMVSGKSDAADRVRNRVRVRGPTAIPYPDRRPMDLPATKAQRSARNSTTLSRNRAAAIQKRTGFCDNGLLPPVRKPSSACYNFGRCTRRS